MFRKILVPLDGSPLAARALAPAMLLAQQAGCKVILVSIPILKHMFMVDPHGGAVGFMLPQDSLDDSRTELSNYLDQVVEKYRHLDVEIDARVREGDEAGAIVETAVAEQADLIIMSTHGRTGLQYWLLGSITERVLQDAPCPVLIIRSEAPVNCVVLPLDGSELAEAALDPGLELAAAFGARTTLLTIMNDDDVQAEDILRLERWEPGLGTQLQGGLMAAHEAYLQRVAARYRRRYADLSLQVQISLTQGSVAKRILAYSRAAKADLLVMATHGRTGLQRWLYGSVTEKVLRGARCHMLVIRPLQDADE